MKGSRVTVVEVPLPREVVELAKARGVDPKELAEATKKLLILEIVAMESKLSMRDALELGKEVTRKAWEKLEREKASVVLEHIPVIAQKAKGQRTRFLWL
ncbi:MAG: hypothetical protein J7L51_00565 [Desulfurococcales archaeon]|nr:hypothetical protein [Desulfurococcales archaeon]